MQQFEIILKNEKIRSYKTSFVIILFLNIVAFLFLAYIQKEPSVRNNCFWVAGGIAIALALDFWIKNKKRVDFRGGAILLIVYAYFMLGYYWLSIAIAAIYVLFLLATRTPRVHVSEENIIYPALPNKKITWEELNNILLKDGVLTIDFKNDKLIQHYTNPLFLDVNEQEFNDFCTQQLALAASHLPKSSAEQV